MTQRNLVCLALALCLTGCQGPGSYSDSSIEGTIPPGFYSPRLPITAMVGAAVYYLYKDNWGVEETKTGGDKFHLTLKKNILRENGDSEAGMIFKRRAGEIATEQGYDGYRIMEYSEGIESTTFGPQRVAQGVIKCYKGAADKK
ncbi:MAG: hypothetical protein PHG47_07955 [Sulfuricella sp.]|nr:hypothetical protein [Sulfuricella sp.]